MPDTQTPSFASLGLDKPLLDALERAGYQDPTPIQARAIPVALEGGDLLLSAQTGSGKTASFVLPILQALAHTPKRNGAPKTHALILTPTRELALQVADALRGYGANLRHLFTTTLVGGAPYPPQIRALKKGVHVIVATPGRLRDHMQNGLVDLSELKTLVLDEADRMLDMGFADDIKSILAAAPSARQTIMSSATWAGEVGKIAQSFTRDATQISIEVKSAHIDEKVYFCDHVGHKNEILRAILSDKEVDQAIVFTATKRASERLSETLREMGFKAHYLHGDLPQGKRNRILKDVRNGNCQILVATDVVARGIDVPAISHVVNYDLPRQVEDYVHRIGRSGRAGRTGTAKTLCNRDDLPILARINRFLKRTMPIDTLEDLEPKGHFECYEESRTKGRGRPRGREFGKSKHGAPKRFSKGQGFGSDRFEQGKTQGKEERKDRRLDAQDRKKKTRYDREKDRAFKTPDTPKGMRNQTKAPTRGFANKHPANDGGKRAPKRKSDLYDKAFADAHKSR